MKRLNSRLSKTKRTRLNLRINHCFNFLLYTVHGWIIRRIIIGRKRISIIICLFVYIYIYILFKLCLLSEFFRGSLSTNSVNTVPWNVNKFSSRYRPVCLPLKNFGRRRGWQLNKHGKALLIGVPLSNIWGICCDAASFRWIIHYHAVIKHRFAETVWEMARLLPHCSLY